MAAPTTPAATLREAEQRFLSQRTDAAVNESWDAYAKDMLPVLPEELMSPIHQGFEAGYAAAINRVRMLLANLQAEVNAAARKGGCPPECILAHRHEKEGS